MRFPGRNREVTGRDVALLSLPAAWAAHTYANVQIPMLTDLSLTTAPLALTALVAWGILEYRQRRARPDTPHVAFEGAVYPYRAPFKKWGDWENGRGYGIFILNETIENDQVVRLGPIKYLVAHQNLIAELGTTVVVNSSPTIYTPSRYALIPSELKAPLRDIMEHNGAGDVLLADTPYLKENALLDEEDVSSAISELRRQRELESHANANLMHLVERRLPFIVEVSDVMSEAGLAAHAKSLRKKIPLLGGDEQ